MTEKTNYRVRLINKAVDWLFISFLAGVATLLFPPLRDWAVAIATMPQSMTEIRNEQNRMDERFLKSLVAIRDDIDAIRRPNDIFEIAKSSSARDGFCVASLPCTFNIVARRTPEGASCKIIAGETEYFFVNPVTGERRRVNRVNMGVSRNIGLDWTDVTITVVTPIGFVGERMFIFIPFYSQCNGTNDTVKVSDESRPILVEIRERQN